MTNGELDYDTLRKGRVISIEQVEALTDQKYGTSAYSLAALNLAQQIEGELRQRGMECIVCQRGGNLSILPDEDASVYCDIQVNRSLRRLERAIGLYSRVDVSMLSAERRKVHDRNRIVAAAFWAGAIEHAGMTSLPAPKELPQK